MQLDFPTGIALGGFGGRAHASPAMNFVWFLMIGLAAGWLAGQLTKGGGFGLMGNLIVGAVGAILGGFLFGLLGFASTSLLGSLITATVGAIILLVLIGFITRGK